MPLFSILHRMIFRELARVFLLSLLAITGLLLVAGIVTEASQQGLRPEQVLAAIPLLIPSTLPYTIPAATLFAVCVVYGRLAADNEVQAVRGGGIRTLHVVWPGLALAALASAATLTLYHDVIPSTHLRLRSAVFEDLEGMLYAVLAENHQIALPQSDYSIWVEEVQGRRLFHATFKRKAEERETDMAAVAREAELRVDLPNRLLLVGMRFGTVWSPDGTLAHFEERVFDVPLPKDLAGGALRRPRDMTWRELGSFRDGWTRDMARMREEIARARELLASGRGRPDLGKHTGHLHNKVKLIGRQVLGIDVERHMRPALALSCFCFVLIGCPVALRLGRSDYLSSFVVSFLPIVLVYYPLLLCGTGLATAGQVSPVVSVWAADGLIALAGVCLLRRIER